MKKLIEFLLALLIIAPLAKAQPTPTGSDTLWVKQIGAEVKAVKFSPDGQFVYAGVVGQRPMKLSASTGEVLKYYDNVKFDKDYTISAKIDVSTDGAYLIASNYTDTIKVLDTETGNVVRNFTGNIDKPIIYSFSLSKDQHYLIAVYGTQTENLLNTMIVWDFSTGQEVLRKGVGEGLRVLCSPDNKYLALGYFRVVNHQDAPSEIEIYNMGTWEFVKKFEGHSVDIQDLAFSPDGSLLASCAWDGYIKIWDMNTMGLKTEINTIDGNSNLEFINNNTIISGGKVSYVKIWDINTKTLNGQIMTSQPKDISVFTLNGFSVIALDGEIIMFNYSKYVGVESINDNNIFITPNPFNTNLSFNINQNLLNNIKIELFDNLSNSIAVIFNSNITTTPFIFNYNTETLPTGVYYCKITKDNSTSTHKLIKVR